jgi:L-ribulose-5-phosphate 3-epimerase
MIESSTPIVIGIRQGRLSPASSALRPCFPDTSWKEEFTRAKACGLGFLEWLFAARDFDRNPIWTGEGRREILERIQETGMRVASVSADYFVAHPLVRATDGDRRQRIEVLMRLIERTAAVEARVVVLPVLEDGELRGRKDTAALRDALDEPLEVAASCGVRLAIETDLPAQEFRALIDERAHGALALCYDTGNAAARGFDAAADVAILGPHIGVVHIKDRRRGGSSVRPGDGDVDFPRFLAALERAGYTGPLILEAPPGDDPLGNAAKDLAFLRRQLALAEHDHLVDR